MGQALVRVSNELLRQLLRLPEETKILRVRESPHWQSERCPDLELLVEHKDLPTQLAGAALPHAHPSYVQKLGPPEFESWNL